MNVARKKNNEKGFTIIEVVLVLAIAALIFLMVFIALPALQRSQRDTQRKNDLSRAMTGINNYQSNNRNKLPTDWTSFKTQYLEAGEDAFDDPSGEPYNFTAGSIDSSATFNSAQPVIHYTKKATCDGETVKGSQGANKVALQMKLEGGGIACESN